MIPFLSHDTESVGAGLPAMVVNDYACCLGRRGVLESIASRLAPTGRGVIPVLTHDTESVGAGLQAMVVNDNACCLDRRGALESITSKPAPTGFCVINFFACRKAKRPARGLFGNAGSISVRGL